MMNYKTYLFDFDYTLADSSRVIFQHTDRSHRLGTAHSFSTRVQTGSGCSHEREYPPFS